MSSSREEIKTSSTVESRIFGNSLKLHSAAAIVESLLDVRLSDHFSYVRGRWSTRRDKVGTDPYSRWHRTAEAMLGGALTGFGMNWTLDLGFEMKADKNFQQ